MHKFFISYQFSSEDNCSEGFGEIIIGIDHRNIRERDFYEVDKIISNTVKEKDEQHRDFTCIILSIYKLGRN